MHEVAGRFVQVAIGPDCMLSVKVIQLATRFEQIAAGNFRLLGSCRAETGQLGQVLPDFLYPPSGVKLRPSERRYKPYIVVLLVRYRLDNFPADLLFVI